MPEDKKAFVDRLGRLMKQYSRACQSVQSMEYACEYPEEYVIINFFTGRIKINITGDSCLAIMHDVYKALI
ncbi:MAG: hypothetical protein IJ740_18610 [Ruminococcus sp.]|nr:hypothetical protein [Ruminococcus sp.]